MKTKKQDSEVANALSHFLADSFILTLKTLNYHWNMVGPEFFMYHKLLEGQYKELSEANDVIAERIRGLGSIAPATMQDFMELAHIKEGNAKFSQEKMVRDLVKSHEEMSDTAKAIIKLSDSKEDVGSSDMLIQRVRAHDLAAYLLRSHLEKRK